MSLQLTAGRMAAFSDGVIAVIITVMVLDLKVPAHDLSDLDALRKVLPMLTIYTLSFVEVGIYWVNHHYIIDDLEQVSHGLLWANLGYILASPAEELLAEMYAILSNFPKYSRSWSPKSIGQPSSLYRRYTGSLPTFLRRKGSDRCNLLRQ